MTMQYDHNYDMANMPLSIVACSDGENGLLRSGYTTFASLPTFPNIAAMAGIRFNSDQCGTCWQLSTTDDSGNTHSVVVTAIDTSNAGFTVSESTFVELLGATDMGMGRVSATALDASACGL
ncbi:Cerato-platanin [Schizophyllum amplum]|uniref:Cerato-platanin n=1 Tax=Schizophyllum amplum TaxID=97359 RepID=A0A550CSC5_9AGAR|nr:Cerato-platanin [Auriculariopsis ampla]